MTETGHTAIVAHDAGAANHIIAWLNTGFLNKKKARLCFLGPAENAFQEIEPNFKNYTIEESLAGAKKLISGTGWSSSLEHDARQLAHQQNIPSIAVIDHWVNYKERFIRQQKYITPDEIWVTDKHAEKIARSLFNKIKIQLKPNDYLTLEKEKILSYSNPKYDSTHILFLMEPIRKKWGDNNIPGEIQALNFFIDNISQLKINHSAEITIKPHPSDIEGKYNHYISNNTDICINVDEYSSLSKLISWSEIVVGCHTYAMIVALAANKTVVSALPPFASQKPLPHKEIIQLHQLIKPNNRKDYQ